jgi:hypothetical protein
MQNLSEILDETERPANQTRKNLIPTWIRVFCYLFLFLGSISSLAIIAGIFGQNASLSLYGFETTNPISPIGIGLTLIFLFKGIISYALLTRQDNAIQIAKIDAIIGIAICTAVMIRSVVNGDLSLRLELLLLVPYLLFLNKVQAQWQNSTK